MSGRVDDLVARLRGHLSCCSNDDCELCDDMRDAKDEIERLRARVAELEATVNEWAGV